MTIKTTRTMTSLAVALASLLGVSACGDDDKSPAVDATVEAGLDAGSSPDGGNSTLPLKGKLVSGKGAKVPAKAWVTTWWMVATSGPDYVYKLGQAGITGGTFQLSVPVSPPAAAIGVGGVGMANIALLKHDVKLADGKVTSSQVKKDDILGWDYEHALIYRPATLPPGPLQQWLKPFPVG